jgi:hypothetical protein
MGLSTISVDLDQRTFEFEDAGAFDGVLGARLAGDRDLGFIGHGGASLIGERGAGFAGEGCACLNVEGGAGLDADGSRDLDLEITADVEDVVAADGMGELRAAGVGLVAGDGKVALAAYGMGLVALGDFQSAVAVRDGQCLVFGGHGDRAVVGDCDGLIAEDVDVHIFLRLQEDLLRSLLVFEAQLVEAGASFRRTALDGRLGLLVGKTVGRGLLAVVDRTGDNGAVGVAVEEADNDLLTDAGEEESAPLLACPGLSDTNPAGACLVLCCGLVPVKLDLDASVLIGPDLFAAFADDDGSLSACGVSRGGRNVEDAGNATKRLV